MAGLPRIVVVGFSLRLAAVLRFRTKGLGWGDPEAMALVVANKTWPESKHETLLRLLFPSFGAAKACNAFASLRKVA